MNWQRVDPGWGWTKKFNFHAGWKMGDTVQLSGLVAFDESGNVVGKNDAYAQSIQIFQNIKAALESAGSSLDEVVKITTYLTSMDDYKEYSRARSEIFPDGVPASSTVGISALATPDLIVEIEAMAVVGSSQG
ncbi:RidA family protein [Lentibacter algarum]|uniref:RidA family protein n=1 Tax=Lentibacter algarum TaxID=576131 RepID=UPI001C0A1097|nr:RidA family protein [Lentibacter algarum]MBU2983684.1 RidA family protein [Lentibacter algarum]